MSTVTRIPVTNTQVAVKYRRNVGSLSIDMSADNRTTPLDRHIDRRIGRVSVDICSADISSDTTQSTYRRTLDRYVDRHIGRHSADMPILSVEMSVEGCTKYTWSKILRVYMVLGDAFSKLEVVWILNSTSRSITWSLFTLKASYLVKWPISTRSFRWWCQFID